MQNTVKFMSSELPTKVYLSLLGGQGDVRTQDSLMNDVHSPCRSLFASLHLFFQSRRSVM